MPGSYVNRRVIYALLLPKVRVEFRIVYFTLLTFLRRTPSAAGVLAALHTRDIPTFVRFEALFGSFDVLLSELKL